MDYSLHDPLVLDATTRLAQAEKILRVLNHFTRAPLTDMRCLDVGCSSGIITRALAQRFASVVGVDVDWSALALTSAVSRAVVLASEAMQSPRGGGEIVPCRTAARCVAMTSLPNDVQFASASALSLPFAAESFDVAVCNQVYQYVPDVPRLFADMHRVLRHGGICYFSARNLWGIAARENCKPFAAVLFPSLARDQQWRHRAGTLWPYHKLRAVAQRAFIVHDYTTRVLNDAGLSHVFVPVRVRAWLARAPRVLLAALKPFMPTHIWVLQKP